MSGLKEPLSPDWKDYDIEDVADLDGDGIFEVALSQKVEGSMGVIGGCIFKLDGDRLNYIESSRKLERGRGSAMFQNNHLILSSFTSVSSKNTSEP